MNKITYASVFVYAALTLTTPARAETTNCTAITTLPYTISSQGVYCLTGHLDTAITVGHAITINNNNVVLDLNGFKLGGLAAGLGTSAVGIYAYQRANITIKNGTVRGFYQGIFFEDTGTYTTSQGHIIEDIRADQNRYFGFFIQGKNNFIRNNQIVTTGGTTVFANTSIFGIYVLGAGARVLNNDVIEVTGKGTGSAYGVYMTNGNNSVVAGNRISSITAPGGGFAMGIDLGSGSDFLVSDNRLTGMQKGIYFDGSSTGKYMNNMTQAVTTPYTGGTAAGSTNF